MRVLIVGDAVVSTGFSRCTHALADTLHARGHEVAVLGINYWGDPHKYPYPIFPTYSPVAKCRSIMGTDRLPKLIHSHSPDAVVILNDPWNIQAYFDDIEATLEPGYPLPKMIGWLAVDARNHKEGALNKLDHIVVWTKFAKDGLRKAGAVVPMSVVPLGIDEKVFTGPKPRSVARKMCVPLQGEDVDNLFIVGVVGRNQHRKRLDTTMEVFRYGWEMCDRPENWRLFLHVAPTGEDGYDLPALADYFGIRKLCLVSNPEIGSGVDNAVLPYLYSSFDAYLSTSQAEGWGLPAQEAMSCGVPCVLPRFASFGPRGWVPINCAWTAGTRSALATAPFGTKLYTVGGLIDVEEAARHLRGIYESPSSYRSAIVERAQKLALSLTLERTGTAMADVVESVVK